MSSDATGYQPPTSAYVKARQDEIDALRLLIAQRRLYGRAKRWLGVRWAGMVVIGLGAPVFAAIWPDKAVVAGAVAGLWLFLVRTLLMSRQTAITESAAGVQEQFDLMVFAMPEGPRRSSLPTLEEIARIAGPDEQIPQVAVDEELLEWYPIDESDEGTTAIAIAQRANASYTNSLLRTTATTWAAAVGVWIIVLVAISVAAGLTLAEFLLGAALPVLPAFLDVVQYVASVRRSASEKADLANEIEDRLGGSGDPIAPEELLVWQSQIFELRRSAPEVPDLIYRLTRKKNELAMRSAARQLSDRAKRKRS